jgi:ABC-2 type transport system ATP-binding protein
MSAFVQVKDVHQTYPVTWSLLRWMRQVVYQRERRGRPQDSLQGVNLEVEAGVILGLVGPASSGKSTLLRVVAGLLQPTRGEVRIGGEDLFTRRARLASRIGYVVREARSFRAALSPRQNLIFFAGMAGLQGHIGARRVEELVEGFGLVDVAELPCRLLSEGTLRRLSVARALLTNPELLVMDEETAGLDPIHRSEFYGFLLDHVRQTGCTVLYATHNLNEAQFLCHQVALMDQGRVIAQGRYLEVSEAASALFTGRADEPGARASLYPQQTDLRQTRRRQSERW